MSFISFSTNSSNQNKLNANFPYTISNNIEVYEEPMQRVNENLTLKLNSRPVRRIELCTKVCTGTGILRKLRLKLLC